MDERICIWGETCRGQVGYKEVEKYPAFGGNTQYGGWSDKGRLDFDRN